MSVTHNISIGRLLSTICAVGVAIVSVILIYNELVDDPIAAEKQHSAGIEALEKLEYQEAVQYFEKAASYDDDNSSYKLAAGRAAAILGDYDAALDYFEDALSIEISAKGDKHPSVAICLNEIGIIYRNLGKYLDAIEIYRKALRINNIAYGNNNQRSAQNLANIGIAYANMGQYRKALDHFERALSIEIDKLGATNSRVSDRWNSIGYAFIHLGEYQKAMDFLQKAYRRNIENLGEDHPKTVAVNTNIAYVWAQRGRPQKAKIMFENSLVANLNVFGGNHPAVGKSYFDLGRIKLALEQFDEAENDLMKAKLIMDNYYHEEHPDILNIKRHLDEVKSKISS